MSDAMAVNRERLGPVAANERVALIDILRGFALLGILVVNFWGSSGDAANRLDKVVSDVLDIAVSSSFYPLFSFLFGLGFAMQLLRARERGAGVVDLYLRRMLALFLIGTFHAIVIWDGDILVLYAVLGLLLIPLHRLRDRWLWPIVAVSLVLGLWEPQVRAFTAGLSGADAAEVTYLRNMEHGWRTFGLDNITQRYEADPTASRAEAFRSAVAVRWRHYAEAVRNCFSRNFFLNDDVLAFFVMGLIVGRRRILQEASLHKRALAIAAAVGLTASIAGTLVTYVVEPENRVLDALGWYGNDYGTTVFYIAGLALAVTSWSRVAAFLRPLGAVGQIGLTNYLIQSTVMTLVFTRYGMGLREPSTAMWVLINLTFFVAVQIPLSRWWIARFRFGPAEWVWRSMTYGERQPMRIRAPAPVAAPPPAVATGVR